MKPHKIHANVPRQQCAMFHGKIKMLNSNNS